MANRLAGESSPYLLQHAGNPVDWYPWGPEALQRAVDEDKPIFLSIGYSACHWCHVMEHESFENPDIAELLNRNFICIKVDREERPDLDQIYMQAVQMLTGRGGWPMSVFLLPSGEPFFGGTYWPPTSRMGMAGFDQVLRAVMDAWRERRGVAVEQGRLLSERMQQLTQGDPQAPAAPISEELLRDAVARLERTFDYTFGGFGDAPKFPHTTDLQLLLRCARRFGQPKLNDMVRLTLSAMARGGIFDHLGGGFARYSVDRHWLVPHFEKMLYDNAQLAAVYTEAHQALGDAEFRAVAESTLDYVLRDLTDPAGGFHSTEDADSEGEEGKFYVWTPDDVRSVLGDALAERFKYVYDVTDVGNFEGRSILNRSHDWSQYAALKGWDEQELRAQMAEAREKLLEARSQRVRPGKDDKVLVSWNGLMIHALARASAAFDNPRYLDAGRRAADFLRRELWSQPDGRLRHTWRHGVGRLAGYVDDYACLAHGLVSLYEADADERWIEWAVELADVMLQRFQDHEQGGFYFTPDDHEPLIARPMDWQDSSVPSGNGMAATVLIRLGRLAGRSDYLAAAERTLARGLAVLGDHAWAATQLVTAADLWLGPSWELVAIVDDQPGLRALLGQLGRRFLPNVEWAVRAAGSSDVDGALAGVFAGKQPGPSSPTVYVCSGTTCREPVHGGDLVERLLDDLASNSLKRT